MRVALYYAPPITDPLHAAASAWLGRDAEVQTLEDALCLVFLETQLAEIAARKNALYLDALARHWAETVALDATASASERAAAFEQAVSACALGSFNCASAPFWVSRSIAFSSYSHQT